MPLSKYRFTTKKSTPSAMLRRLALGSGARVAGASWAVPASARALHLTPQLFAGLGLNEIADREGARRPVSALFSY